MAYPTITDLKLLLGITASSENTLLTQINDGAKEYAERRTGRVFESASAARSFPLMPRYIDGTKRLLTTRGMDFTSVSSLVNADGSTISSTDYTLLPVGALVDNKPYYQIRLTDASGLTFSGDGLVVVTAAWGFDTTCPAPVFTAIMELGAITYRARMTGNAGAVQQIGQQGLIVQPGGIPATITDVLDAYRRA